MIQEWLFLATDLVTAFDFVASLRQSKKINYYTDLKECQSGQHNRMSYGTVL